MAVYTIDQINERVDEKFEATEIDLGESGIAKMLHPLRLPKDRKARFKELMAEFNELQRETKAAEKAAKEAAEKAEETGEPVDEPEFDEDALMAKMTDILGDLLRSVLANPTIGDALLGVFDDLEHRMGVLEVYMETSQMGEASPSPS